MKKWSVLFFVALLLAGCPQQDVNESREQAYSTWSENRADVYTKLAKDHYSYGQLDKALEKAAEAHKLSPDNLEISILWCKLMIEEGQYGSAQKELQFLRDQYPRNGEILYLLGVANERKGEMDKALACYKLAEQFDASTVAPVLAATEILISMGKLDEAQAYLDEHTNDADQNPGVSELAGRLAMMQGKPDRAAHHFSQAWSANSKCTRYLELLARAQLVADRPAEALETIKELRTKESFEGTLRADLLEGDCLIALGRYNAAIDAYRKTVQQQQRFTPGWERLARAYLQLGQWDQAMQAAEKVSEQDPDNLDAALTRGYVLLRRQQPREALSVLHGIQKDHPNVAMVHALLGLGYSSIGQSDKARQCYRYALWLDPKHKVAKELSGNMQLSRS